MLKMVFVLVNDVIFTKLTLKAAYTNTLFPTRTRKKEVKVY